MHTLRKLVVTFGALSVVLVLAAGPALATEAGSQTTTEEAGEHGGSGVIVRTDDGKLQLPLDPERPRDAVGLGLIAVTALALMAALVNARK
ncbi:MAG TPA: hypothetical protein VGA69_01845, partial [Nitriliruptorales bacterium]